MSCFFINTAFVYVLKCVLVILGSVFVRGYGTTKSFVLKTHGSHDKIIILSN